MALVIRAILHTGGIGGDGSVWHRAVFPRHILFLFSAALSPQCGVFVLCFHAVSVAHIVILCQRCPQRVDRTQVIVGIAPAHWCSVFIGPNGADEHVGD